MAADPVAFPDTLVGTDSHTTMVNGLSVLGWGVGGIEAEAAMLGQPISMLIPEVVGFRLTGKLPDGVTATDLVLTVTEMLRQARRGRQVRRVLRRRASTTCRSRTAPPSPTWRRNMARPAASSRSTRRRCAISRRPARKKSRIALVEAYAKAQGLFRDADTPDPVFTDMLELDLGDGRAVARRAEAAAGPRAARQARPAPSPRRSTRNTARRTRPASACRSRARISISAMATW